MDTEAAASVLSSQQFQFVVGPEKKQYSLHSHLVSKQSAALHTLINGEMKEAKEGVVNWEHVDEWTFLCFGQYLYTTKYDPLMVFNNIHASGSVEEWRSRLLCHARMYMLADCYGIGKLMDFSSSELRNNLASATTMNNKTIVAAMPSLLDFCWTKPAPENLQRLVMQYVLVELTTLWKDKTFQELLDYSPEFVLDFTRQLGKKYIPAYS